MAFWDRISFKGIRVQNAEPNAIEEVGIETDDTLNYKHGHGESPVDLVDAVPFKVKRTIKNCRFAAQDPTVKGILNDILIKTLSNFVIDSNNEKARKYILERDEEWDIKQLMHDMVWAGMVDGECFINKVIVDNKIKIRLMAFDGVNYRFKRLYNEFGEVIGYKQLTKRNKNTNQGWLKKKFEELIESLEELTTSWQPGEIINPKFLEKKGKGQSTVMDVLDPVYYKRVLSELMPRTVYKNSNIMVVTMGNEKVSNKKLSKKSRGIIAKETSNYHKKGVVIFPYGISAEMIGNSNLPDIPSYKKDFKSEIFEGLNTPEAVFSQESSNRSTAEIQLDSKDSGRVLYFMLIQEWVKKHVENDLFKPDLELQGFSKDTKVWIDFNPTEGDESAGYLEKDKDKNKSQKEGKDTDPDPKNRNNSNGEGDEEGGSE